VKSIRLAKIVKLTSFIQLAQNAKRLQEQVDHVKVEVDGGQQVFFGRKTAHEQVRVVNNKETEEQRAGAGAHQLECVVVEKHLRTREQSSRANTFRCSCDRHCECITVTFRNESQNQRSLGG